jgi:uncharacterized protein
VKAGQVVKVKVLEVDQKRKRIALTMRLSDTPSTEGISIKGADVKERKQFVAHQAATRHESSMNNSMAEAFAKLKK